MSYIVATDVGGTFVDAVIRDDTGRTVVGKAPSTPAEPALGVLAAIGAAARQLGLTEREVLRDSRMFRNGTTVTTNAMLQRRGARTGLLITAGFEDTLAIGRVLSRTVGLDERALTDYQHAERPAPVVPSPLTRGIAERIDCDGTVLCALDPASVERAVDELVASGIEALAICFLWSFANPAHERLARDIARERHPRLYVSASSDLVPLIREYERANTTCLNAYLGPTLRGFVGDVERRLASAGFAGNLLIMQSVGGLSPAAQIQRVPVTTLLSGPVGGVIAAQRLGERLGDPNVITTDMGGTSFDVGLIAEGETEVSPVTVIARQLVMHPTVAIETIGAGGGSVAWIDPAGALRVGPQSQGARPGPAAYGEGGELPTVTDADVVLGYIDPAHFLGGAKALHPELAAAVIERHVGVPLGMSLDEAAAGIHTIVNAHMADLIRRVTIDRGHDPRRFSLFAFGGCGPTHATGFAPDVECRRVVIPPAASVFSALGIATADIRHFFSRTATVALPREGSADERELREANAIFAELVTQARAQLAEERIAPADRTITLAVDVRYRGQAHELVVPLRSSPDRPLDAAALTGLRDEFVRLYEMRYGGGARSERQAMELVNLRVEGSARGAGDPARGGREPADGGREPPGDPAHAAIGARSVYWLDVRRREDTPVYDGERLRSGDLVRGRAIVELYAAAVPLYAGQELTVDPLGDFVVSWR